jgi:lysophospholipase L1-like esterase
MRQFIISLFLLFSCTLLLNAEPIKIMPLGDSITKGHPYSSGGYRSDLWAKLQNAHYDVDFVGSRTEGAHTSPAFDYNHEGYDYYKTFDLSEIVYNRLKQNPPDVILLHIGSNDVSPTQGTDSSSIAGLRDILNEIDHYEENYHHPIHIILASIINRASYHRTVTEYNRNLRALANTRIANGDKITLINMETGAGISSADFADATHPNYRGYGKMANVWFDALNHLLPAMRPPNPLIKPFVERFYRTILLREGEEAGVTNWIDALASRKFVAADLARSFIFSEEFKNQGTDNQIFLERLYSGFFNRAPDTAGLTYWKDLLNNGTSRFTILNGFLHSTEFKNLTESYNIVAVDPSEFLVERFYTKALERDPEQEGFAHWVNLLKTKKVTASQIARNFFFSEEFIAKNTDNAVYLTLLYRTLLGREPDAAGLASWKTQLDEGISREKILEYFIYSPEFKNLANAYRITL